MKTHLYIFKFFHALDNLVVIDKHQDHTENSILKEKLIKI